MELFINGKLRQLNEGATAGELLKVLSLEGKRVAVEVNREIVPRSEYTRHVLQPGDRVEVVQAIGGG